MASQDSKDLMVQARLDAACELYQSCVVKARDMLESTFKKPNSYYDGEKKNIIQIAETFFKLVIDREDVDNIANKTVTDIRVASISKEEKTSPQNGDDASVSNSPIMGF